MKSPKALGQTIVAVIGAALLAAGLIASMPSKSLADPKGYVFTLLARIPGGQAPGGGLFDIDFEPLGYQ